jgi:site-specific recombinase XerD
MPRRKALTLEEVLTLYHEEWQVQGFSPRTIIGYRRSMRCFLRWAKETGVRTVADFTADSVKRSIAVVQQKHQWADNPHLPTQPQTVSATTVRHYVRNYVRDLKAFASWLEREGDTPENVLTRVRKPQADEVPVEPFSQAELDAIFGALDLTEAVGLRDAVILHTLWDTGLRMGELVDRTVDDVDLKRGEMRIDHAKWGKWRDLGFGKQTQKYVARSVSVGRPVPVLEGDRHLFLSVDGYPLTASAVQQVCRRLSKRLGFRVHPHRVRHTFAVGMLRNGTDIRTLRQLMGHASVQILMRYLTLANDEAMETHRVNSPADKHYALTQAGARRLPMRTAPRALS